MIDQPKRIRSPRTAEDMEAMLRAEEVYRQKRLRHLSAKGARKASNDEPAQEPRKNVALIVASVALTGTEKQATFFNSHTGETTKPMSNGRVVKNLQDSYRAATKPIAPTVKDKAKAAARRKTSLENGDAYYEAARQMNALEGVQPRMVVRFFRRRAKHLQR